MKKLIVALMVFSIMLGISACVGSEERTQKKFIECAESAEQIVNSFFKEGLEGKVPYQMVTEIDGVGMKFVITCEAFSSEAFDRWIRRRFGDQVENSGLDEIRKEAAYTLMADQFDAAEKAAASCMLLNMTLPVEEFNDLGATIVYQYKNRYGSVTIIDEKMMSNAVNS